ncbi:hypothetical protein SDC9_106529 [bioreactor metagenome]|uniref:Uncharacterized protein n=1 Tax=bioreactor metagenome TaxID=1076179 RepID=A0A645B981_9ZZZZ
MLLLPSRHDPVKDIDGKNAHLIQRLDDGGQGGKRIAGGVQSIESDDRHIVGNPKTRCGKLFQGSLGHPVVETDEAVERQVIVEQIPDSLPSRHIGEGTGHDQGGIDFDAVSLKLLDAGTQSSYRLLMGFRALEDGKPTTVVHFNQVLHQRSDALVAFHCYVAHPLHPHADGNPGQ